MSLYDYRSRYAREGVGAFVLLMVVLFLLAVFNAERVQEWLDPGESIKVVLPEQGLFGLSAGAAVEILGTNAGEVIDIVIDPEQNIHANIYVRRAMIPFVRRDSVGFIRKRFGIAGESYLEITRGVGEPLDWEFAVLEAQVEQAPTETVGELLQDIRNRVFPLIGTVEVAVNDLAGLVQDLRDPGGNLQQLVAGLSAITGRMQRGEGALGRLLTEDRVVLELEGLLAEANNSVARLAPILDQLQVTVEEVSGLAAGFNAQSSELPKLTRSAQSVLSSLDQIMRDLRKTTPELPHITRNIGAAADSIPVLLVQTQQTMVELELLLKQLRQSWLFGGGGGSEAREGSRIPPELVRP
jgi:phospholipid/cholesterol/gamma-HCH transport system substrate-binding protein